jgi:hypothetical protein
MNSEIATGMPNFDLNMPQQDEWQVTYDWYYLPLAGIIIG